MGWLRERKRKRVRAREFPEAWRAIMRGSAPLTGRVPREDQEELRGRVQVFLSEKNFEGCDGLELNDRIRVTIAANACVLLLRRESDFFPGLRTVLVYPSRYTARTPLRGGGGIVTEGGVRAGESWQGVDSPRSGGPVILSWSDVERGAVDAADGQNVVLHEFAHQLDAEWGGVEGAPLLGHGQSYEEWSRVLGEEFGALRRALGRGEPTLLGAYAATSPAEFFAVSVERFFERGAAMRAHHPDLYAQLSGYFNQDPAGWTAGER